MRILSVFVLQKWGLEIGPGVTVTSKVTVTPGLGTGVIQPTPV